MVLTVINTSGLLLQAGHRQTEHKRTPNLSRFGLSLLISHYGAPGRRGQYVAMVRTVRYGTVRYGTVRYCVCTAGTYIPYTNVSGIYVRTGTGILALVVYWQSASPDASSRLVSRPAPPRRLDL